MLRRQPRQQVEERRRAVAADHVENPVQGVVQDHRSEVFVVAERLAGDDGEPKEGAAGRDQGQGPAVAQAVPEAGRPVVHGETAQTAGSPAGSQATGSARPAAAGPRASTRSFRFNADTVE